MDNNQHSHARGKMVSTHNTDKYGKKVYYIKIRAMEQQKSNKISPVQEELPFHGEHPRMKPNETRAKEHPQQKPPRTQNAMGRHRNDWIASDGKRPLPIESEGKLLPSPTPQIQRIPGRGGAQEAPKSSGPLHRGSEDGGKGEGANGSVPRMVRSGCWIAAPSLAGGEVEDGQGEDRGEREAASSPTTSGTGNYGGSRLSPDAPSVEKKKE